MGRGLTGRKGCAAAERRGPGSASGFTFGSGAEGRTGAAVESFDALSETDAERTWLPLVFDAAEAFAGSSHCGVAHSKSSVARTIYHLSLASGLASPAPLAMEPLYWPKVQETLVPRSHFG